ncbi:MAG: DUF3990 domain-containing protein [Kiritimatiellae bacterium]|nr:DUF3990 domain-containing protein [Kiritimatiellia bacterium]
MILYHGSNMAFGAVDLARGLPAKDFGRGFYVCDSGSSGGNRQARTHGARSGYGYSVSFSVL